MTNASATFKTNVSKDLKPRKQKSINTKARIINWVSIRGQNSNNQTKPRNPTCCEGKKAKVH